MSFSLFMHISSHVQFVLSGNGSEAFGVLGGLDTHTVCVHFLASLLLCCAVLCLWLSWRSAALPLYGPFSSHILHFLTVGYCQKSLVGSTAILDFSYPPYLLDFSNMVAITFSLVFGIFIKTVKASIVHCRHSSKL